MGAPKTETVWRETAPGGVIVKVNKRTLPPKGQLPEKVDFSVVLSRAAREGDRTIPLHARQDEVPEKMVDGLERTVISALCEQKRLFKEMIEARRSKHRPDDNRHQRRDHRPSRDARNKVGTHGRKRDDAPKEE
jgi:hypothetical protein